MNTAKIATTHVVALSGGKDSTALALRLAEIGAEKYRFICTPTGDELPEMQAHWSKLARLLGQPIEHIKPPRTLNQEIENQIDGRVVLYVGLRADEEGREGGIYSGCDVAFPFRDWGWRIDEVQGYLMRLGVQVPSRTDKEKRSNRE